MRLHLGGIVRAHLEVGCPGVWCLELGSCRALWGPEAVCAAHSCPRGPNPCIFEPQCSAWPRDPQLDPLTAQGKPAGGCVRPGRLLSAVSLLMAWNFPGGAEDGVTGPRPLPGRTCCCGQQRATESRVLLGPSLSHHPEQSRDCPSWIVCPSWVPPACPSWSLSVCSFCRPPVCPICLSWACLSWACRSLL